jgi:hypothetical protein
MDAGHLIEGDTDCKDHLIEIEIIFYIMARDLVLISTSLKSKT